MMRYAVRLAAEKKTLTQEIDEAPIFKSGYAVRSLIRCLERVLFGLTGRRTIGIDRSSNPDPCKHFSWSAEAPEKQVVIITANESLRSPVV
jgi:hypothetical protein